MVKKCWQHDEILGIAMMKVLGIEQQLFMQCERWGSLKG
jgi:hypothetical protein